MFTSHVIGPDEHLAWFERVRAGTTVKTFIHETLGVPDGVVNFTDIDAVRGVAFWGFYAAPGAPRGTGTALGIDALDQAFDRLCLVELKAKVLASNERSIRYHAKLGFRREDVLSEAHFDGAKRVDVLAYAMTRSEWSVNRVRITSADAGTRREYGS